MGISDPAVQLTTTNMIPVMPALIPANTVVPKKPVPMIPPNTMIPTQHLPGEDTVKEAGDKVLISDQQLHKALDDQIQLVKQIQTLLGTEQMKLEFMMSQFNKENMKRKEKMLSALDEEKVEPKRLRVCSPDYINKKKSVEMGVTESVNKELETFRNFWSHREEVFNEKEIDIKQEPNCVDIKDLVMEELA